MSDRLQAGPRLLAVLVLLALTACSVLSPPTSLPQLTPSSANRTPANTAASPSVSASPTPAPDSRPGLQPIADIRLRHLPGTGGSPAALAILGDRLYVANWATDNVSVIEGDRVTAVIDIGGGPSALAADPVRRRVYVANQRARGISILEDGRLQAQQKVDGAPRSLAVAGDRLFVGLDDRGSILVYDTDTLEPVAEITLPNTFAVFSMETAGDRLFAKAFGHIYSVDMAANRIDKDIVLTDTYITLAVGAGPSHILADHYDLATQESLLVVLDATTGQIIGKTVVGGDQRGIAVDRATGRAYVVSQFTRQVFVVDLSEMAVVARVPVGLEPEAVVLDPRAARLYVANRGSQSISVIDTANNRVIATIPLTINPQGVAIDAERGTVYVAVPATASLLAVTGQRVSNEIVIGGHPTDVAVDERRQRAYVVDRAGSRGVMVDLRAGTIVGQVSLAPGAGGAQVDPIRERVYLGDAILDAASGELVGRLAVPTIYGTTEPPVKVLPASDRLYVVAPNGIPGSNYGLIIISALAGDPPAWEESRFGGVSTVGLAWDSGTDRLYSTAFRFGTAWLYAEEGSTGTDRSRLELAYYPAAMALYPPAHRLALGLVAMGPSDVKQENLLRLMDTRTMKVTANQRWDGEFGAIVFDARRGWLFITDPARGLLSIWGDVP